MSNNTNVDADDTNNTTVDIFDAEGNLVISLVAKDGKQTFTFRTAPGYRTYKRKERGHIPMRHD